jgi:hypothetical protein
MFKLREDRKKKETDKERERYTMKDSEKEKGREKEGIQTRRPVF